MMGGSVRGRPTRARSRGRRGLGDEMLAWSLVDVDPF
jgi:hypothetical protein